MKAAWTSETLAWRYNPEDLDLNIGPRTSPWRWWQHWPLKRWCPTTTIHDVITQKTWTSVFGSCTSPWRWRRHGRLKRWYTLHGVTSHKTSTWILDRAIHPEDGSSLDLWNLGILPQHYTASQPRKPLFEVQLNLLTVLRIMSSGGFQY
jgi:hypothetical protein